MAKITDAFTETLVVLIRLYQILLRPLTGHCCRFTPTCSSYAIEALRMRGAIQGMMLAIRRLSRCHPWREGGYDPVPLPEERKCQVP